MAVYKGVAGIERLQQKIIRQHKSLVEEAIMSIAQMIVDESPVGTGVGGGRYPSQHGMFNNDPGDFKNSWLIDYTGGRRTVRTADPSGRASITEAGSVAKKFNFQSTAYIYNTTPQAKNIEKTGWEASDPFRQRMGWDVNKPPKEPVSKNKNNALELLRTAILVAKGVK